MDGVGYFNGGLVLIYFVEDYFIDNVVFILCKLVVIGFFFNDLDLDDNGEDLVFNKLLFNIF